jgi:hypothetical protein
MGFAQDAGFDHTATRFVLTGAHENTRCESCHQQGVFRGTPTECSFCHGASGTRAESVKPFDHPRTGDRCQDCHVTTTWLNVRFDHAVVSGRCSSCHNGIEATGKPSRHIVTSADCDVCHIDVDWKIVRFDHDNVVGSCSTCHNGMDATGKPNGHFGTTQECDECHSTRAWLPDNFRHASPNYPGDHRRNLDCTDCHRANTTAVQWPFPALQPDCGACHQSDFKADAHEKHENPDGFYTASDLRDCTGACHVYTDPTLSVIKERRNGEHRVSDGGFD